MPLSLLPSWDQWWYAAGAAKKGGCCVMEKEMLGWRVGGCKE